jgi:hypothetical protein
MEIRTEIRKASLPLKTPAALSAQLRFEANAKASLALRLLIKFDIGPMERGRSFVAIKQNAERCAAAPVAGRDYYSSANSNLGLREASASSLPRMARRSSPASKSAGAPGA